ncbi:hypothetical protein SAMN05216167_12054 [Spirosoma endophyticum]|uniref:Uncharacterized protein n=1 Tax=Spirosoma endophyticum TaxID=662367 RepID=A0A1I2DUK1_9BACT|nr:hypothetical protein SAMN05216167_12054 [Spirosoma endophyticum]
MTTSMLEPFKKLVRLARYFYRWVSLCSCLPVWRSTGSPERTYFLSAGAKGWQAVLLVALIYNVITLSGMLLMVSVGQQGLSRVNPHWPGVARFEHNENILTGLTLVGLAVLNFFIEF